MTRWLQIHSDLDYSKAMLKARKIQRDEAKLRKLGMAGNYVNVAMRLTFDGPGHKRYGVFVEISQ